MTDLITIADLKLATGEEIPDEDQAASAAIAQASGILRSILGYNITEQTYTDYVDPINGSFIELEQAPVTSVASLEIQGRDGLWTTVPFTSYTISRRLGIIAGRPGVGLYWPTWPESWRVTYTAGYATVPDAIKAVVCNLAARILFAPVGDVKNERIGGYSVTYGDSGNGLTPPERSSLRAFQRGVIA